MKIKQSIKKWLLSDYTDNIPGDLKDLFESSYVPKRWYKQASLIIHRLSEMPWYTQRKLSSETKLTVAELMTLNSFIRESKEIQNDLQKSVRPMTPEVDKSLKILSNLPGSFLVSMSGSGPSCFALFQNYDQANKVLKEHFNEFERAGLSAWACSMMSNGVQLKNEFT